VLERPLDIIVTLDNLFCRVGNSEVVELFVVSSLRCREDNWKFVVLGGPVVDPHRLKLGVKRTVGERSVFFSWFDDHTIWCNVAIVYKLG
jgi:hypothetical protein